MKTVSLFISLVPLFFTWVQKPLTDLEKTKLKGRVKTLTESEYEVISASKTPLKGKMLAKFSSQFNEKGNVSETQIFNPDGSVKFMHYFTFDKAGNQIESRLYNPDMSLGTRVESAFDENGNKTSQSTYDYYKKLVSKTMYKFDETNIILWQGYGPEGTPTWTGHYIYDNKGNEIEENRYNEKGELEVKWINNYDNLNRLIQTQQYSLKGHLDYTEYFKYDSDGNETEDKLINDHGVLTCKTNTKYTNTDETCNWVRKITYKSGKPFSITERVIVYY